MQNQQSAKYLEYLIHALSAQLCGIKTVGLLHHKPPQLTAVPLGFSPQINYVTFPSLACMTEQQLLKPKEWSYCDFFWVN